MDENRLLKVTLLLLGLIQFTSPEKHCSMSSFELSCTYDSTENRSLTVRKTDIKTLDLSGSVINDLDPSSVSDYTNVEELNLSNCRIRRVERGTFSDLYKLVKLNLSDNLMTSFNTNSFEELNALNVLILSNNLLSDLDAFRIESFPKLKALDLSGNVLKYLPHSIINKMVADPSFSIYINQNQWDCNNTHWKDLIQKSQNLRTIFCDSSEYATLEKLNHGLEYVSSRTTSTENNLKTREICGFSKCRWWIIGSLWIGVILGNVNKLNKLLYQSRCRKKKVRFTEKSVSTETDPHQLRQEKLISSLEEAGKQKL